MFCNNISSIPIYTKKMTKNDVKQTSDLPCETKNNNVSFNGFFQNIFLPVQNTYSERKMYNEIYDAIDIKDRKNLEILKKTGRLKNRGSNNNSSTLENLYRILKNPRIQGLESKQILSETMARLANPFIITQKFGTLPPQLVKELIEKEKDNNLPNAAKNEAGMDIKNSATCVAASIEFNLADKKPAEYARLAEGFSSPQMSVNSEIRWKDISNNLLDSVYLVKIFNAKVNSTDFDKVNLKIAPDRNAIVRARVQASKTNPKERSSVDVLLQSAFMQLGSQLTYDSLTDKRYGSLSTNDTGLTEFEKTFTETIINNEGEKTSLTYQQVDDNSILTGYTTPPEMVKKQLIKAIDSGSNVIIGITETDSNNKIIGGHEVTLIGYNTDKKDGETYFVYQDSDDNITAPVSIKASVLIPKIHHAGLPAKILENQHVDNTGVELLKKIDTNKRT